MTLNSEPRFRAIEVWLTQRNLTIKCMVVHEDEATHELEMESLSMRGAQREITGELIGLGYTPVGRWESVLDSDQRAGETVRRFRLEGTKADVLAKAEAAQHVAQRLR
jgi:hypothetical protein